MKKSALLIAFHFPPQSVSSGVQRTLSFSKHLGQYGWQTMLLSAHPAAYPVKNMAQLSQIPSQLIVRRAFALDTKRHLGLLGRYPEFLALPDRWISWWLFAVPAGLSMIRKYRPTVLWSTFPLATSHLIGLTLHRLTGIPWVADFRDPMLQATYPDSAFQRKAYEWIERQTIARCQKAVFTTKSAMDAYKQRFPQEVHKKFTVIENGYDEDGFSGFSDSVVAEEAWDEKREKTVTLLHSGMLYAKGRDPSAFFEAISNLKTRADNTIKFLRVILRATGDEAYFKGLVKKYDIEDIVTIEPAIPYREALREMLTVDGLIVFQGTDFNTQVPAKIYEYFRARKPIFGLLDFAGETARVLNSVGFENNAPMSSTADICPALRNFILRVQDGTAYAGSDEVVTATSRAHRAHELANVFEQLSAARS